MRKSFFLLMLLITSCSYNKDYKEGPYISPSKKYFIELTVNHSDKRKDNYALVMINIYDNNKNLLKIFNTHAGDAMKWAINWMPAEDIIIMNSGDIGIYAWKINFKTILINIKPTREMIDRAQEIKFQKYGN